MRRDGGGLLTPLASLVAGALLLVQLGGARPCGTDDRCVLLEGHAFANNTEFHLNPYREGETLLGNHLWTTVRLPLGDGAEVRAGVFLDIRAGDEEAFRAVRPVLSLTLGGPRDRFVMGTLDSRFAIPETGPYRQGLHGLLPPIQQDELGIARANETGLAWFHQGARLDSEAWLAWQLLNTPSHREQFDAGWRGQLHLAGPLSLAGQWQVVHHGGQLFTAGQPVADSHAAALGLVFEDRDLGLFGIPAQWTHEGYVLGSRYTPDRSDLTTRVSGHGFFYQTTIRVHDWRFHVIEWWGRDFIKEEGDANYGFLRSDGTLSPLIGSRRHYGEYGLYKEVRRNASWTLEAGARIHDPGTDNLDYAIDIRAVYGVEFPF